MCQNLRLEGTTCYSTTPSLSLADPLKKLGMQRLLSGVVLLRSTSSSTTCIEHGEHHNSHWPCDLVNELNSYSVPMYHGSDVSNTDTTVIISKTTRSGEVSCSHIRQALSYTIYHNTLSPIVASQTRAVCFLFVRRHVPAIGDASLVLLLLVSCQYLALSLLLGDSTAIC